MFPNQLGSQSLKILYFKIRSNLNEPKKLQKENDNQSNSVLFHWLQNEFTANRYRLFEKAAIAITTNKGISSWREVMAGNIELASAILDRLISSANVFKVTGRSYQGR